MVLEHDQIVLPFKGKVMWESKLHLRQLDECSVNVTLREVPPRGDKLCYPTLFPGIVLRQDRRDQLLVSADTLIN